MEASKSLSESKERKARLIIQIKQERLTRHFDKVVRCAQFAILLQFLKNIFHGKPIFSRRKLFLNFYA